MWTSYKRWSSLVPSGCVLSEVVAPCCDGFSNQCGKDPEVGRGFRWASSVMEQDWSCVLDLPSSSFHTQNCLDGILKCTKIVSLKSIAHIDQHAVGELPDILLQNIRLLLGAVSEIQHAVNVANMSKMPHWMWSFKIFALHMSTAWPILNQSNSAK